MLFVERVDISPVLALIVLVVIDEAMRKIVLIVLAVMELVRRENVEIVEGKDVKEPLPGAAPLILDTHIDKELK